MAFNTSSHRILWLAATLGLVLSAWAPAPARASVICDFEDPADRFCTGEGMQWSNSGGQPAITHSVWRSSNSALYNNFNAPITYDGPAVQTLWIRAWAGFAATVVTLEGPGIVVDFSSSIAWQRVDVGGATHIKFVPDYFNSGTNRWTYDFGTFAIDDVEFIPEPATLALLALGGLAVMRRRRTA